MVIESIVAWLTGIISALGYPGVALAMFIESFFAPIPSELIMPFAGFLAAQGEMNVVIIGLVGGIASYLGSLPFYFLGRVGKEERIKQFINKYGKWLFISESDVEKGYSFFKKHGNWTVFFGRLIPIIRTVISFPAGMAQMNYIKFSAYTLAGSLIWSYLLTIAGYLLGENWEVVGAFIDKYQLVVIVIGVLIVLFLLYKLVKRRNKQRVIEKK